MSTGALGAESGSLRRKSSLNIRDTRIAGLYDLEKTIGQGHFAVVKLAKHVFTGEKVAVKIIDKTKMDVSATTNIMKEVRCMKLVQHANIVRLYEVLDTQTKLFLILELGDYDLHDFIVKHEKGVTETIAQQYFCQIMIAIDYCHQLHVVHRDLKPENVVFFEKLGMVKLTDFGFSNSYEPGQQLNTSCGSLAYSAPEILLGDSYDAPAVDVWSLGVILFMLVCGRLPFQEANDSETLTKILDCKYAIPEHLSASCKSLIQSMLVREPSKRSTLEKIVSNIWVTAGDRGHATAIPLIVRHHLPQSAHTTIIEQMVAGGIGSEDEILRSLENDEYNSVTATYYLLAERVLSTYREEQARALMAKEAAWATDDEGGAESVRASRSSTVGGSRCRSRSNSWRARPCTILKEESEEELSSYLRSASRQSSRFYSLDHISSPRSSRCCSAHLSRQSSDSVGEDGVGGVSPAVVPSDNDDVHLRPNNLFQFPSAVAQSSRFEDMLSPIDECQSTENVDEQHSPTLRRTRLLPSHASASSFDERCDCEALLRRPRLVRRNSSPSVSMFGAARDRVSPQAVQDLLEFNRLGGSRGRAASPDSVRSSRSPSPPATSSGRASPAMSSLSRLKVSTSAIGGMRKLSSSPHLLGICEEGEENGEAGNSPGGSLLFAPEGVARTNRSASTGLVHIPSRHSTVHATKSSGGSLLTSSFSTKTATTLTVTPTPSVVSEQSSHSYNITPTTYSSVRMIRPRQAIVSPDVCRRYEQHQRFIARSRRSTSCSSSEASDDEDRRLTIIASRCGGRRSDDKKDKDDDENGHGGLAGSSGTNGGGSLTTTKSTTDKASTSQNVGEGGGGEKRAAMGELLLKPIPEMTQLDLSSTEGTAEGRRMRLLHRSHTAERIVRDWTCGSGDEAERLACWVGTPPRDVIKTGTETCRREQWIRRLQRSKSQPHLLLSSEPSMDSSSLSMYSSEDLFADADESALRRNGDDLQRGAKELPRDCEDGDSGCSSDNIVETLPKAPHVYDYADLIDLYAMPIDKVHRWLRTANFH